MDLGSEFAVVCKLQKLFILSVFFFVSRFVSRQRSFAPNTVDPFSLINVIPRFLFLGFGRIGWCLEDRANVRDLIRLMDAVLVGWEVGFFSFRFCEQIVKTEFHHHADFDQFVVNKVIRNEFVELEHDFGSENRTNS